ERRGDPPGREPGQALPDQGGRAAPHRRSRQGRRRRLLRARQGRDARHRGGVGLRQVNPRPDADAAGGADRRHPDLRRRRRLLPAGCGDAASPARHPDRLPGPLHLAEPPHDRRRHRRRAVRDPSRRRTQGRASSPGSGAARPGWAQPRTHQPLSAPVLRRAAAADRDRPRCGAEPQGADLRRAGLCAGRVGAGSGGQPARAAAGRAGSGLRLHRPRPVGGAPHLRPGRGDVPRGAGRDRGRGADLLPAHPSLHPGAALGRSGARPDAAPRPPADSAERGRAQPGQPAVGMPFPHPLLQGAAQLRRRRPVAGPAAGRREQPRLRLPLRGSDVPGRYRDALGL
ncbi:MAG: Oligopeptide transport ATP-binding protein OppF, partial [uncultured Friedmanniella sp.]